MTVPPDETEDAYDPVLGATLEAFYTQRVKDLEQYIEASLASDVYGPIPAMLKEQRAAREALEDQRARRIRAEARAAETRVERLQRHLLELEHSIAQQEARAHPGSQGLSALYRRREALEDRLEEALRAEQRLPTTPEQLRAAVTDVVDQWPDDLIEVAIRVLAARHRAEVELVSDGRRARLGPDGWVPA